MRALLMAVAVASVACDATMRSTDGDLDGADGPSPTVEYRVCPPGTQSCELPTAHYVPAIDGEFQLVWVPSGGRYVNEPTLIQDDGGTWHMFSNGAAGEGGPWVETQLLHATAPSLLGPWTEEADILTTHDPDATEVVLWAPFVLHDGANYRVLYYDGAQPFDHGLHSAHSSDLFQWTRDPEILPGGRDPFVLSTPGADLLFTTGTENESDGVHDIVALFEGPDLSTLSSEQIALRNPVPCPIPDACWGWYESPYVVSVGGSYYLFTTYTASAPDDYNRTQVFRSDDPTRFAGPPVATLDAHGAELHVENGRMYLTRGGWPARIGDNWRGLSLAPIVWIRVD